MMSLIACQITSVYGKNPLVGEYSSTNKNADVKIVGKLAGGYKLSIKESEEKDWEEIAELRPATIDELQQTFGDRWNRVETSLVLQDGLVPQFGFYYIKAGQFGTDLFNKPTCLLFRKDSGLMVINKFDPAEAAIIEKNKNDKENEIKARSQKVEELKTATTSDLSPHDRKDLQDWNAHAGQIVEWRLNVRDVKRAPNNPNTYLLKTGHDWEVSCEVELVSGNEQLSKIIEGISPNTSIAIRGKIVGIENSNLLIGPAILIGEQLSSSIIRKIETLSKSTEKGIELSEIKADINPDPKRTTIQQENINRKLKTLKGTLVEGTFTNYSAEPTSSGCVLVQYDGQSFKQRDNPDCITIFSPVKSQKAMEQLLPMITSGKPIAFRGYISEVQSGLIQIDPAILIPPTTVALIPKELEPLQAEAGQSPVPYAPAAAASSATVPAMPGERFPETRLRLLGPADLTSLGLDDLRYAVNEMYARRGASFKQAEIAQNFTSKEWYKPRPGVSFDDLEKEFSTIEADNLKLLGKERERKTSFADLYELIDSESNLREGPGKDYPIVRKSRKGEVGEALSKNKGWVKLKFSDGSMAWAHEQNIKAAK